MTAPYGYTDVSGNFPLPVDFDIRESIHNTLYGSVKESPKGQWAVFQKVKRDEKNLPIKSSFTFQISEEGKHNNNAPGTTRTGYLCDEYWVRVMLRPAGRFIADEVTNPTGSIGTNRIVILMSGKEEHIPEEHDFIIMPKTDSEGNVLSPVTPYESWKITVPYHKALDNGRIEYHALIAEIQY